MNKPKKHIPICISRFAKEYGVAVDTFKEWIKCNPVLKEAFSHFMNEDGVMIKRSLPPSIETLVYTTLGEP